MYAFDPSLATRLETLAIHEAVVDVPWEPDPARHGERSDASRRTANRRSAEVPSVERLEKGPVGEYLEVVDYDPASQCFYEPVDLDHPHLLAQNGLGPSEGNPKFHQQMVYAVAMKTIEKFELALGRKALWSPRESNGWEEQYVQRLRVYPHALREPNAYYSPDKKALLFGYFPADASDAVNLPGGMIFTCLSHDIIAHETTHALLDGLHPRFIEPSNPDVRAFHEAFADVVALFQHFTMPEALRQQLARTRGDLGAENLLGELAQQFGHAAGLRGALRSAIGHVNQTSGRWEPSPADRGDYERHAEPHARGAVLVAAVFEAFLSIYRRRTADLMRIATGGSGVLPAGELHPDLIERLAREAAKTADHVLRICIRALDYCPPFDLTFGEYLRALVTADYDLVPYDDLGYRVAFIDAFRRRGIYPRDVRSLSTESLRWRAPREVLSAASEELKTLWSKQDEQDWDLDSSREQVYSTMRKRREALHKRLREMSRHDAGANARLSHEAIEQLGLELGVDTLKSIRRDKQGCPTFEVHSIRPARRIAPDRGRVFIDLVVELTQSRAGYMDEKEQAQADNGKLKRDDDESSDGDFTFRGGCTMLVNARSGEVRYCICKRIDDAARLARQREYEQGESMASLRATYFGPARRSREPFAMLHRGSGSSV